MSEPRTSGRKAILLMGATATGKTDLAVRLNARFPMEIISVDSALIYRQMDIGTAKPDAQTLARAPHHLIDILDPAESWSAWAFVHTTLRLIDEICARGRIPLLVGGTMMYFNALQQGMNELPMAAPALRADLEQRLQEQGLETLYDELKVLDPASAERIKPTDPQRILRALEVCRISGRPMSALLADRAQGPDIEFQRVILEVADRAELHQRIALRFEQMIDAGFEQEVVALRQRGDLDLSLPSMRCVGYRQMWQYLDQELSHQQMIEKSVIATRQLAKRQMTWLRKYTNALKLDYRSPAERELLNFLELTGNRAPG